MDVTEKSIPDLLTCSRKGRSEQAAYTGPHPSEARFRGFLLCVARILLVLLEMDVATALGTGEKYSGTSG